MDVGAAIFAILVVLFVAVSARLSRWYVTAPIAFAAVGALLGDRLVEGEANRSGVLLLAEVTLVLLLFHDAAQVRPRQIQGDRGVITRLLLVGVPLSIFIGTLAAGLVLPGLSVILALLLAAALAPTDAALGAAHRAQPAGPGASPTDAQRRERTE